MTSRSRSSTLLAPLPVELEDTGAYGSASDSEMEHFSDASEGRRSSSRPRTRTPSPVPRTRVEKVDDSPRHGEVPGSEAYQRRETDAVPDGIEIVGQKPAQKEEEPARDSACASPVPRMVVEKIDPGEASHGEMPGTPAYEARVADAAPDAIVKAGEEAPTPPPELALPGPVPETLLTRVESPTDCPSPSFTPRRRSPSDALPDAEETVPDAPRSPSRSDADTDTDTRDEAAEEVNDDDQFGKDFDTYEATEEVNDDDQFGEDFDTFEVGDEQTEQDDFGDFDDAFEEPTSGAAMDEEISQDSKTIPSEQPSIPSFPPLLNFDAFDSISDLMTSTTGHLDTLFPKSNTSTLPPVDPISNSSIFTTERSLSLWSQLVAPPPLQPPNWTRSRIRRLFLVSLGVPVDLDEILPASKQKKLVLPSINLDSSTATSHDDDNSNSTTRSHSKRNKKDGQQRSSASLDSGRSPSHAHTSRRRRGKTPPPQLDLTAVRRFCATTDAALDGFTDDEMRAHVETLERMAARAQEVLQYWLRKRDEQLGDKEAFEGVIENLVKHARQVRK